VRPKQLLDELALHSLAASVDDAHFAEALLVRRLEVRIDDVEHVARSEVVEIDRVADLDLVNLFLELWFRRWVRVRHGCFRHGLRPVVPSHPPMYDISIFGKARVLRRLSSE
jgi:hypothetical protein